MTHETVFYKEWKRYLKENGLSGISEALEHTDELQQFVDQPETISRFCSGARTLSEKNLLLFSNLFKVRPEYLAGKDTFRTDDDILLYIKKTQNFLQGMRIIFNNLGYVDSYTESSDYNQTFPENTIAFIEGLRDSLHESKRNILVDVQNNRVVPLTEESEEQFINEILSFIQYKLNKLFDDQSYEIPVCITESGEYLWSPHNEIQLKDGKTCNLDFRYISTARLLNATEEIDITPDITISDDDNTELQ